MWFLFLVMLRSIGVYSIWPAFTNVESSIYGPRFLFQKMHCIGDLQKTLYSGWLF